MTGPMFTLVWKESFDNAYMVKDDGIMLSEEDIMSIDSMPIGGSPSEVSAIRNLLHRYGMLFQPRQKGQYLNYPKVKYKEIDPGPKAFGRKWERPRPINDPRALESCCQIQLEDQGVIEKIDPDQDLLEWNVSINMVIDKYVEVNRVRKPKYRLCIDSRNANCRKEVESSPAVSVEKVFQGLAGKSHQSALDLPKAFFSMEVDVESRKFSSFTHPVTKVRYCFNGMVMGDVNSPSHFQTFMQRVFREEEPYLDDLAVGDVTFPQHLHHLESIFQRCKENNISLSPSK